MSQTEYSLVEHTHLFDLSKIKLDESEISYNTYEKENLFNKLHKKNGDLMMDGEDEIIYQTDSPNPTFGTIITMILDFGKTVLSCRINCLGNRLGNFITRIDLLYAIRYWCSKLCKEYDKLYICEVRKVMDMPDHFYVKINQS